MPSIGDVEIPAITTIDAVSEGPVDELQNINFDQSIIVEHEPLFQTLDIAFVLYERPGTDDENMDVQRENVKSLADKDVEENDFDYLQWDGYLLVEEVNIPRSSDSQIMRFGTMRARFIPKHEIEIEEGPDTDEGTTLDATFEGTLA